jgi:hypothetical protein
MTYSRKDLPQLTEKVLDQKGLSYEHLSVKPWCISPMQKDRLPQTEERYLRILRNTYKPLIVDNSLNLIDGHHRHDLLIKLNVPLARVIRINLSFQEILEVFQK